MKIFKKDALEVRIYDDRVAMGSAAAEMVGQRINELLERQHTVNIVFAAAPSQNEFLAALGGQPVDWHRVNAFHMDEYIGLDTKAPQGFGNFLKERLFSKVTLREVHYLDGNAANLAEECGRYRRLLETHPTDIVILGIGENTHLAFNDPHVARFDDPFWVKVVKLDKDCRRQQVNDGCFATLDEVPEYALTMTIPALLRATYAYVIVPGERKARAVDCTLNERITQRYPSTVLRRHPRGVLFADKESMQYW
jgi:glucosamine-6-phosphate deaminase